MVTPMCRKRSTGRDTLIQPAICHHMVVARTQTIVQLSDELLAALDERALRAGISRSALIRAAIDAYLKTGRDAEIDAAIIEGYTRIPPEEHDPWAEASTIESIRAEPW